jgi:hypothetical protein
MKNQSCQIGYSYLSGVCPFIRKNIKFPVFWAFVLTDRQLGLMNIRGQDEKNGIGYCRDDGDSDLVTVTVSMQHLCSTLCGHTAGT